MFGLGFSEILVLLLIVMVLFGSRKIPELGSSLAMGIRNFQKGLKGEVQSETGKLDSDKKA